MPYQPQQRPDQHDADDRSPRPPVPRAGVPHGRPGPATAQRPPAPSIPQQMRPTDRPTRLTGPPVSHERHSRADPPHESAARGEPTRVTGRADAGKVDATTTEAAATTTTTTAAAAPSLTVNKVLAGAGAAATTAVMGSFFGATGTVTGAALGSVVSTVVTAVYQRSLDRTKETVLQKVKLPSGASVVLRRGSPATVAPTTSEKVDPYATVPLQRKAPDEDGSTVLVPAEQEAPEAAKRRIRKRIWVPIAGAAVAFVAAMALITGIEALKGSSLSGTTGTSVSRVVSGTSAPTDSTPTDSTPTDDDRQQSGGTDTSSSSEPTSSPATPSEENGPGSDSSTRSSEPSASTAPSASVEVQVPLDGSTRSDGSPDAGDSSGSDGTGSGGTSSGGQDSAN